MNKPISARTQITEL